MRKKLWLVPVCLAVIASSYWWTIEGPWLSQATSFLVSRKFHVAAHFRNVKVVHWSEMSFDSMVVDSRQGESLVNAGQGQVVVRPLSSLWDKSSRVFNIRLKHVIVFSAFYKSLFTIPFSMPKWLEASSVIDELSLRVAEKQSLTAFRILRAHSPDFVLQGGVEFNGRQIYKAHLLIFASEEILKRLPGILRSRLLLASDGWQGVRIIYYKSIFTAIGQHGPFFKFQWQSS